MVSGVQPCEELPCFVLFLLSVCECACVFEFGLYFDGEVHVMCDACLVVGKQCLEGFVCGLSDDDEEGFHMRGQRYENSVKNEELRMKNEGSPRRA